MSVVAEFTPVARKHLTCSTCHGRIRRGQRYRSCRMSHEGSMHTWKEHPECGGVGARAAAYWYGLRHDGYNFEDVQEYLLDLHRVDRSRIVGDDALAWWRMNFRRLK